MRKYDNPTMGNIVKIEAYANTADVPGAGTDAWIVLGIAGREFVMDTVANDNEQGTETTFVFGEDSNVVNADRNDPRTPQLHTSALDRTPTYVRIEDSGENPEWALERLIVTVTDEEGYMHRFDNLAIQGLGNFIWLGQAYGRKLYLYRV